MPDRHELRTVEDFFAIPQDKRAACLHDFGLWLDVIGSLNELLTGIDGIRTRHDVFVWVDDDKHDAIVSTEIVASTK